MVPPDVASTARAPAAAHAINREVPAIPTRTTEPLVRIVPSVSEGSEREQSAVPVVRANLRSGPLAGKGERCTQPVNGIGVRAGGSAYFLAGRVFMILSISPISRGALLIRSSPRSVMT